MLSYSETLLTRSRNRASIVQRDRRSALAGALSAPSVNAGQACGERFDWRK
jgi:hypothetical protein